MTRKTVPLTVALALVSALPLAAAPQQGGALPGPFPLFPPDNWYNADISAAPLDPSSAALISFIGGDPLHPDLGGEVTPGSVEIYGQPYIVVDGTQAKRAVWCRYWNESDGGFDPNGGTPIPFYPIPDEAITQPHWIQHGEPGNVAVPDVDRHMIVVDRDNKYLYELYNVYWDGSKWTADSGAFFDMKTNNRRPEGWTSATAAGTAILPGLVRYEEVYGPDEINHAFSVTVRLSNGYVYPASHIIYSYPGALPLGARLRLKASKDISGLPPEMQKIARAMKKYGLIVNDLGVDMFVPGTFDTRWNNSILNPAFAALNANDFEVVQLGWKPGTTSSSLAIAGPSPVTEGNSGTVNANFTVTLSPAATTTVTVNYATTNGTATAGSDYTAASGTLTFAAGQTSKTIPVAVLGDTIDENDETFYVTLSGPTNATVGTGQATATILDDDAPAVTMSISDTSVTEGNSGTTNAVLTVTLSAAASQTVTVNYATANGTATAGSDYAAQSGNLTFTAGQTSKTITILVTGDTAVEPNETFVVNLSGPLGATLSKAQGQVTITNDDSTTGLPAIVIDDRSVMEGSAANASFRVKLSSPSAGTVTVAYSTANGTAVAPSDYAATSGTLTFTPGRTVHSIAVPIVTDTTSEGTETFTVTLSGATNATIARSQGTGTIQDPPAQRKVSMYRAYNPNADYHFFTTSAAEFTNAVAAGYRDESTGKPGFCVMNTSASGTVPIFRMYNPNGGRHYYSTGAGEREVLRGAGWVYETDEGWIRSAPASGSQEIFRLYNQNSGVHLYTEDPGTKNAILAAFPGIWVQHASMGYAFARPSTGVCP